MEQKLYLNDLRELNEETRFEQLEKNEQLIYLNDLRIEQKLDLNKLKKLNNFHFEREL